MHTNEQCLLLHALESIGERQLRELLLFTGSTTALWESNTANWPGHLREPGAVAEFERLRDAPSRSARDTARQLDMLEQSGATVLPITDPAYPVLLHTIHDPPPLLYCRGRSEALQESMLAIVGSRRASSAGLRCAGNLASEAVTAGLGICSGLALGIDGAAHRGAVDAGGTSVAVMATGIEQVYPRRHGALAESLLDGGCLITEFAPGTAALKSHFPRRNRIISGLSLGVLVVEAALPSGSLITAGTALEQGREVFALPWSMLHPGGAGCLRMLRDGAVMVESIDDVLLELGPLLQLQRDLFPRRQTGLPVAGAPPESAHQLLALLGFEAVAVDQLVAHSGLPVAQVLAQLSALELAGVIEQRDGGYLRR